MILLCKIVNVLYYKFIKRGFIMERSVLKSNAKSQLKGKWWLTIAALLVSGMISSVTSGIISTVSKGLGAAVSFCISGIVSFGVTTYSLNVVRNRNAAFTDIFDGFNLNVIFKALVLGLITTIATTAGLFLLIVPGIIIGLMFSQAFFILVDNPELSPIDCIKESAEMMKGHKVEYFVLYLSFIGWVFLISIISIALIVVGIYIGGLASVIMIIAGVIAMIVMSLFLGAYVLITFANYYVGLKSMNDNNYSGDDNNYSDF